MAAVNLKKHTSKCVLNCMYLLQGVVSPVHDAFFFSLAGTSVDLLIVITITMGFKKEGVLTVGFLSLIELKMNIGLINS